MLIVSSMCLNIHFSFFHNLVYLGLEPEIQNFSFRSIASWLLRKLLFSYCRGNLSYSGALANSLGWGPRIIATQLPAPPLHEKTKQGIALLTPWQADRSHCYCWKPAIQTSNETAVNGSRSLLFIFPWDCPKCGVGEVFCVPLWMTLLLCCCVYGATISHFQKKKGGGRRLVHTALIVLGKVKQVMDQQCKRGETSTF